jgi:hypothetical protein
LKRKHPGEKDPERREEKKRRIMNNHSIVIHNPLPQQNKYNKKAKQSHSSPIPPLSNPQDIPSYPPTEVPE